MNIKINFQAGVSYQERERILKYAAAQCLDISTEEIEDHITQLRISRTRGSIYFTNPEDVEELPKTEADQTTSTEATTAAASIPPKPKSTKKKPKT